MKIKFYIWLMIYIILAAAVFYICYVEKERDLLVSLFGPLFVGLIALAVMKINQWFKRGEIRLLSTYIMILVLMNLTFYVVECVLFCERMAGFLLSAVTFTLVYSGISWMRYKRGVR